MEDDGACEEAGRVREKTGEDKSGEFVDKTEEDIFDKGKRLL